MEIFVTVIVVLAMTALGVLLIHLLDARRDERVAAFPYGRSRPVSRGRYRPFRGRRTAGDAGESRDGPVHVPSGTRVSPGFGRGRAPWRR